MKTMRAVQREQLTRPFNCQHFHSASLCSVQIDDDDDDDEEALDRRKRKKMCGVEMGKKTNIYSFVPPSLPPSLRPSLNELFFFFFSSSFWLFCRCRRHRCTALALAPLSFFNTIWFTSGPFPAANGRNIAMPPARSLLRPSFRRRGRSRLKWNMRPTDRPQYITHTFPFWT